jgi:hypothetical protein
VRPDHAACTILNCPNSKSAAALQNISDFTTRMIETSE